MVVRVKLRPLLFLCLLLGSPSLLAEEFSTSNLQLLYGSNFHDRYYGNNTSDGNMTTLTLEHFGTWAYGDNFFFIDLTSGRFVDFGGVPTGSNSHIYAEWAPRISLSKLSGKNVNAGFFKDIFLAGELNRDGLGFHAELIGLGTDLEIPGFNVASLNLYLRKDNLNKATYQVTAIWALPLGSLLSFEGYIDINGTDNDGTEINTQPQLLLDIGQLLAESTGKVMIGVEWYVHRNRWMNSSVPQAMTKWVW